jgi:signal transduction histidine kinase
MSEEQDRLISLLLKASRHAALGQLMPIVAHEMNNPLAVITNNLYLLERDATALRALLQLYREADVLLARMQPELAQRLRDASDRIDLAFTLSNPDKALERARNGVRHIQGMVRDLLGFSLAGVADGTDVNAAVEATLRLLQRQADKKRVTLRSELAPLPALTCCPAAVHHVVLHLVQNALESSPQGGTVTVRTSPVESGVALHVLDNGPGIDPALRERIFEPFFTTKPAGQGNGLGLSIVHGLLAEHGGRIDVASTPGAGAHITVQFPMTPPVSTGTASETTFRRD